MCHQDGPRFLNVLIEYWNWKNHLENNSKKNKPQSKKNLLLDSDNILNLRLMHRLISGLIQQIVFFEKDDLSSIEVVNGLRKCFIQSGEHLFSIKRGSLSTSIFINISQYLNLDKEDPICIAAKGRQ